MHHNLIPCLVWLHDKLNFLTNPDALAWTNCILLMHGVGLNVNPQGVPQYPVLDHDSTVNKSSKSVDPACFSSSFSSPALRFVCKNNGVLFENQLLQIGIKSEYRQNLGESWSLRIGNCIIWKCMSADFWTVFGFIIVRPSDCHSFCVNAVTWERWYGWVDIGFIIQTLVCWLSQGGCICSTAIRHQCSLWHSLPQ